MTMEAHSCQVCGRDKKLTKAGRIPKHRRNLGRNRRPECPGSGELPLDQDVSILRHLAQKYPDEYLHTYRWALKQRMAPEEREEIEACEEALQQSIRALSEFTYFAHTVLVKYTTCRVCGNNVNEATFEYARRRMEEPICSPECQKVETTKRYGCCEKATMTPCVCMYSFTCPEHGDSHIGSHD